MPPLLAKTPYHDYLYATYPHATLSASGMDVGLPPGQMGNSEVGHLNLGAGRIVYQDLTRINKAIIDGELKTNPVLREAFAKARRDTGCIFSGFFRMAACTAIRTISVQRFATPRMTPDCEGHHDPRHHRWPRHLAHRRRRLPRHREFANSGKRRRRSPP